MSVDAQDYVQALRGVVWREMLRFLQQRERFLAALVRPLVWLFLFAAGFRAALGLSIIPPYETYITYDIYITPGLVAMIQLFNGMQSSLSMVYDREMGSMRVLLTAPLPRWFLLLSRLTGGVFVSILQVYAFLAIAYLFGVEHSLSGDWSTVFPALVLSGPDAGRARHAALLHRQAIGKFRGRHELRDLPDVLRVIRAVSPCGRSRNQAWLLHQICAWNPFTHAVELIRFALYGEFNLQRVRYRRGRLRALHRGGGVGVRSGSKGLQTKGGRG